MTGPIVYTPEQVAKMLQLSTSTVYGLIQKGEIEAKKFGRVYRIPAKAISFAFTGLDEDLLAASQEDKKSLTKIQKELSKVRAELWESE